MNDTVYLTTAELANRWGMNPTTLRNWRSKKKGPPYFKPNGPRGETRYNLADIEEWEKRFTVESDH